MCVRGLSIHPRESGDAIEVAVCCTLSAANEKGRHAGTGQQDEHDERRDEHVRPAKAPAWVSGRCRTRAGRGDRLGRGLGTMRGSRAVRQLLTRPAIAASPRTGSRNDVGRRVRTLRIGRFDPAPADEPRRLAVDVVPLLVPTERVPLPTIRRVFGRHHTTVRRTNGIDKRRSQVVSRREGLGAGEGTRTLGLLITSELLCRLSYSGDDESKSIPAR